MENVGEKKLLTVEKTYIADHVLTKEEAAEEGNRLIDRFIKLFKGDQDVQSAVIDNYFNYSVHLRGVLLGSVFLKKGVSKYTLNTLGPYDSFSLRRDEGDSEELLLIEREQDPLRLERTVGGILIRYKRMTDKDRELMERARDSLRRGEDAKLDASKIGVNVYNNGSAIQAARELLAKAQKDFGKA